MVVIKKLAAQIKDEVGGVRDYAICALEQQGADKELARVYHDIAKAEYEHVQRLHEQVVRKVSEAEASGVEVPEAMRAKWDEEHREIIGAMADAKVFLDMYR